MMRYVAMGPEDQVLGAEQEGEGLESTAHTRGLSVQPGDVLRRNTRGPKGFNGGTQSGRKSGNNKKKREKMSVNLGEINTVK